MTKSLRATIATPGGKAPYVRRLFATIADRYDLITVLLSYGQDRRWKRRLLEMAEPLEGLRLIDLACGTGDIAVAAAARGAVVTGLDLTPRMIQIARDKTGAGSAFGSVDRGNTLLIVARRIGGTSGTVRAASGPSSSARICCCSSGHCDASSLGTGRSPRPHSRGSGADRRGQ